MFEIGRIYRKTDDPGFVVRILEKRKNPPVLIGGGIKESFVFEIWDPDGWYRGRVLLWNREIYEEISEEEFLIYRISFK
jgi:hypothetical protein